MEKSLMSSTVNGVQPTRTQSKRINTEGCVLLGRSRFGPAQLKVGLDIYIRYYTYEYDLITACLPFIIYMQLHIYV